MAPTAELIISLLNRLQIKQCHLVAYSMGGRLGLYLLTHYPKRFTRAVIESASPGLKTDRERQARRLADKQVGHDLATMSFDQFLDAWYTQPLFQTLDQTDPRFQALLDRRLQSDPVGLSHALEQMGTGTQPPLWESLKNINRPVLFIAGEHDARYRTLATEMASLCPRGRTAIIQGAGHNVHFERPKEYSAEVTKFFGKTE
jgi:2-succinyl-6-hydroxy-2,4-cyclohexadiene-1-carboxylate synthase